MTADNGDPLATSDEQRAVTLAAATAILLVRVGRNGSVVFSGDAIMAGDDVRVLGLLEKCKPLVGHLCAEIQKRRSGGIVQPPPGLRLG